MKNGTEFSFSASEIEMLYKAAGFDVKKQAEEVKKLEQNLEKEIKGTEEKREGRKEETEKGREGRRKW